MPEFGTRQFSQLNTGPEEYGQFEYVGIDPLKGRELMKYMSEIKETFPAIVAHLGASDTKALKNQRDIRKLKITMAKVAGIFNPTHLEMEKLSEYYSELNLMKQAQEESAPYNPNNMIDSHIEAVYKLLNDDCGISIQSDLSIPKNYVIIDSTDNKIYILDEKSEYLDEQIRLNKLEHEIHLRGAFPTVDFRDQVWQAREGDKII